VQTEDFSEADELFNLLGKFPAACGGFESGVDFR